jgi:hypothetical protein
MSKMKLFPDHLADLSDLPRSDKSCQPAQPPFCNRSATILVSLVFSKIHKDKYIPVIYYHRIVLLGKSAFSLAVAHESAQVVERLISEKDD